MMARTRAFDEHAVEYDLWFDKNRFAYESELKAMRVLLPQSRRALEIGVGTGRFAGPLGIKLGVEPSAAMAELARTRGILVVKGVGEQLPFEDESFDLVLMVTVICFLDNTGRVLVEVHRVLVDGGYLLIGLLDRETELGRAYQQLKPESVFYEAADFRSSEEVSADLLRAGFSELTWLQTIFGPPSQMQGPSAVESGYGKGLFAVVRAKKLRVETGTID